MSGCGDAGCESIIDSLLPCVDDILGVRDCIGAVIKPVFFLTRTWFSDEAKTIPALAPEGFASEVVVQMLPSPAMKDYSQDVRLREGGSVKAGDIILKDISKSKYAEANLDGSSPSANVEKLFLVGTKVYQVINVTEQYVTFSVQLRQLSNQTRYPNG
jgi:hypothetical protein